MKLPQFKILAAAAAVIALAVGARFYWLSRPEAKSASVDLGRYFDWNLASGPAASRMRPLISEHLIERAGDHDWIMRLARRVDSVDGEATVELREAVYWSDGTRMVSGQTAAAYQRYVTKASETPPAWTKRVTVTADGDVNLKITGYESDAELYDILASDALAPIRDDLLSKQGDEAWLVTLGPYRLADLTTTIDDQGSVALEPNAFYYRGKKPERMTLKVADLVSTASSVAR